MFKFLLKVLSCLWSSSPNEIIAQTHCRLYVCLKVKMKRVWQRLNYIVLQQFAEKDMIWQASKAKQSKSFQITLEILKRWHDIMS